MYDLPSEDPEEPGLPDSFHGWQAELCSATFYPSTYQRNRVFIGSDLNLYYDSNHTGWYKRPDWFAVVGVPQFYEERDPRMSYVIWQENVSPIILIELLSPSTREDDLGQGKRKGRQPTKWEVYEQILKIPYYVVFDGQTNELWVFQLQGDRYRRQQLTQRRFWIPRLGMGLGLWEGQYKDYHRLWLRWYDGDGNWIPTPEENFERERLAKEVAQQQAEQERLAKEVAQQQAEQERLAKEVAQQQAERFAQRLRQMGIDPNQL